MNEISPHASIEFSGDVRIYKDSKGEYVYRINYLFSNPLSILDKDSQEYIRNILHKWVDDEFPQIEKEDA